jgi:hypothetical protein
VEIYFLSRLVFVVRRVRKIAKSDCWLYHVRLFVLMEQLCSHWTDFDETVIWGFLLPPPPPPRKSVEKIKASLNSDKNNGYFTWRRLHVYDISLSSFRMRDVSDKSCRENKNVHSITFPPRKSWRLWDNVEKCGGVREATNDNMAHARCMLDKQGYARAHTQTYIHRERSNTYCFSTATMVSRTRLNITLYVHCLSCSRFQKEVL